MCIGSRKAFGKGLAARTRPKVVPIPADVVDVDIREEPTICSCLGMDPVINGTRVLVDNSFVIMKVVELSLRETGVNVQLALEAGNGAEVLSAFQRAPSSPLLSDINMPAVDGQA